MKRTETLAKHEFSDIILNLKLDFFCYYVPIVSAQPIKRPSFARATKALGTRLHKPFHVDTRHFIFSIV